MADKDITRDDLLSELLDAISIQPEPSREDGWFRFHDLLEAANTRESLLRNRLDNMVIQGKMEKTRYGANAYYRKVKG
jgi:hypothetical protein